MTRCGPSESQRSIFERRPHQRPVVLFYILSGADAACVQDLTNRILAYNGRIKHQLKIEQVLIGQAGSIELCLGVYFKRRDQALRLVDDAEHQAALGRAEQAEVAVLSPPPRMFGCVTGVLRAVMPWLPMDKTEEDGPEPGLDVSTVMPTQAALQRFVSHPEQRAPIVMINWLKYRQREAYTRYAKVAFPTLHHLRGRALCAGRYQQTLIGRDGDAATDLWDEFVLVRYPGRAAFKRMTALRRYRVVLADREAGLAEHGQGLIVSREVRP